MVCAPYNDRPMADQHHYDLLGIARSATRKQIDSAMYAELRSLPGSTGLSEFDIPYKKLRASTDYCVNKVNRGSHPHERRIWISHWTTDLIGTHGLDIIRFAKIEQGNIIPLLEHWRSLGKSILETGYIGDINEWIAYGRALRSVRDKTSAVPREMLRRRIEEWRDSDLRLLNKLLDKELNGGNEEEAKKKEEEKKKERFWKRGMESLGRLVSRDKESPKAKKLRIAIAETEQDIQKAQEKMDRELEEKDTDKKFIEELLNRRRELRGTIEDSYDELPYCGPGGSYQYIMEVTPGTYGQFRTLEQFARLCERQKNPEFVDEKKKRIEIITSGAKKVKGMPELPYKNWNKFHSGEAWTDWGTEKDVYDSFVYKI